MYKSALLGLICIFFMGCNTVARKPITITSTQNHKPVLLLSFAYETECSFGGRWADLLNTGNQQSYKYSPSIVKAFQREAELVINNSYTESDFKHFRGNVFAYQLEPGTYTFAVNSGTGYYKKPLLNGGVELKSGDIKYIGEYSWKGCSDLTVRLNDQWLRDKRKILEFYPHLNLDNVTKELRSITPARL